MINIFTRCQLHMIRVTENLMLLTPPNKITTASKVYTFCYLEAKTIKALKQTYVKLLKMN